LRSNAVQSLAGTLRPLQILLAAVVVIPLALFAGAAVLNYGWTWQEAGARLERTADTVDEHALKVFETNELILDRVAEQIGHLDWSEIDGSAQVHDYLKRLAQRVPHIGAVGLTGPDGRIVNSSLDIPSPPAFGNHRSFATMPRDGDDDILVSEATAGINGDEREFIVARYKPGTPHVADTGLIFVAVRSEYFRGYYKDAFDNQGYAINLLRDDGAILARYPSLPGDAVLSPKSGFRNAIAARPEQGTYSSVSEVDHKARSFAYRKLGAYPLYIVVGLDRDAVIGTWWRKMASHLIFGIPATLCLVAITLLALSRTRRAQTLLAQANEEAARRERLEASLYQAQKMEAVGQLTGGIAHDFNNLLTAIMGSLEMIIRAGDGTGAPVRKYAAAAMRAAERGARLTQQLLAFSRRQMLRPEAVNLNRLLGDFEELMQRAVGESIDFALELDPGLARCRVDPAQFQSAMLNLVMNARDATQAGGRITIATANTVAGPGREPLDVELAPGGYVTATVRDTGSGMAPEVRAHAFDPFFTTKEVGKGSGLGLSQVYGFARQSGGDVSVESEPGRGTSVRLYLPSLGMPEEARAALAEEKEPREGPAKPARVLVVEDDDAVLEAARTVLSDLGYATLAARNGAEALAILRRDEPIDLLFTDIVMPGGMNGITLAKEARQLRQDIKVLLTSGYDATVAERQGADSFEILPKPYRQSQLADKLAGVLGGR
jgi:signal transduction histidine kinase/CheY-like chemotaxis protein